MSRSPCRRLMAAIPAVCLALAGCSGGSGDAAGGSADSGNTATRVPVRTAQVRRENLDIVVSAQGQTEALRRDRIRAPFDSRLASLRVADGDHVSSGQVIAVIVSRESDAALEGARQMLAAAHSGKDKADAQRAVSLAEAGLVKRVLAAPAAGIVLSHSAEAGDYVDAGEVLATVAETDSIYFNAAVSQSEVDKVRSGQHARIDIPALGSAPASAVVRGLLPMASSEAFSAPVRLDFSPARHDIPLGLFGTAHIVIGYHAGATVVPARAVLRDDVTGATRVAVVHSPDTAHWMTVHVGVREGDRVEIVEPAIPQGTRVITDGQVGLPEGAGVVVE